MAAVCSAFPCFELTADRHIAVPPPRLGGKGAPGSFLALKAVANGDAYRFACTGGT
ncbi:hypothetical protein MACH23_36900 [Sulfitobacter pontiacus]|nr:hypothetical protein MACH23_36900 [Sulfitobacter pontiacus]